MRCGGRYLSSSWGIDSTLSTYCVPATVLVTSYTLTEESHRPSDLFSFHCIAYVRGWFGGGRDERGSQEAGGRQALLSVDDRPEGAKEIKDWEETCRLGDR